MARADIPDDPMSKLSRSVFTLNGLLLRAGEVVAVPLGQSSARWHVLGRANSEPRSVSDIARYIGVSRQSVQRIANVLASEGLVEFRPDPSDRRAPRVHVTRGGAAILALLYARDAILTQHLMDGLDGDQLLALSDALDAVSAVLDVRLTSIDTTIDTGEEH